MLLWWEASSHDGMSPSILGKPMPYRWKSNMDGMSGFGWYCAGGKNPQAFDDSLCCNRFFCWFCWHESRTQEIVSGFPIGQFVKCDTCDNNPDGTEFHYEQTGTRAQLPRDIIDDLDVPAFDFCRDCYCNWGLYHDKSVTERKVMDAQRKHEIKFEGYLGLWPGQCCAGNKPGKGTCKTN